MQSNQQEDINDNDNQMTSSQYSNTQPQKITRNYEQKTGVANQHGIIIDVHSPIIKDGMSKYVLYTVSGQDNTGSISVQRRYSDFYHLRQILVQRWPGCYIPAIPPKKTMGNLDLSFIEERRRQLDDFCKKTANLLYIYYSEEYRQLLKPENQDLEKTFANMKKLNFENIWTKYNDTFPNLINLQVNAELNLYITSFSGFLKKIKVDLEKWKPQAKQMALAKQQLLTQQSTLVNILLPNYEKIAYIEYANKDENKLIFGNQSDLQLDKHLREMKELQMTNSFNRVYDLIKSELRDVEAFSDAIQQRDYYELLRSKAQSKMRDYQSELEKLIAGKSTMKTFFSKGNKEDHITKVEKQIEEQTKEIEDITKVCQNISLIIGHVEIEKFKKEKFQLYIEILKNLTSTESVHNLKENEFWSYIQQTIQQI